MTLNQILSSVKRHLPPEVDREGVACEVWLEAFEEVKNCSVKPSNPLDVPCSNEVIRNHCVSVLRRRDAERRAIRERTGTIDPHTNEDRHLADKLQTIFQEANLSIDERQLVFSRFYLGCSLREIGKQVGLSVKDVDSLLFDLLEKLRRAARETHIGVTGGLQ